MTVQPGASRRIRSTVHLQLAADRYAGGTVRGAKVVGATQNRSSAPKPGTVEVVLELDVDASIFDAYRPTARVVVDGPASRPEVLAATTEVGEAAPFVAVDVAGGAANEDLDGPFATDPAAGASIRAAMDRDGHAQLAEPAGSSYRPEDARQIEGKLVVPPHTPDTSTPITHPAGVVPPRDLGRGLPSGTQL